MTRTILRYDAAGNERIEQVSERTARKLQAADRAALLVTLGFEPEGSTPGDKYTHSNLELARWVREQRAAEVRS